MSFLHVNTTTVNTRRDDGDYDQSVYQLDALVDADNIYKAFKKSCSGKMWKPSVQRFANQWLINLARLQTSLVNEDYTLHPTKRMILRERGKPRLIDSEHIEDRVIQHLICDEVLLPAIRQKIIRDNTASLKGRGIDDCRRRLVAHLSQYYREHGNKGYILIMDYSRYYDNVRHDEVFNQIHKWTNLPIILSIVDQVLTRSMPDLSYMNPEERDAVYQGVYNSLIHEAVPQELKTKEHFMSKSLAAGSQLAQTVGISYPYEVDNFFKIVKGCRFYARYMDDSYVIHSDLKFLKNLRNEGIEYCKRLGININPDKVKICPIDKGFKFLQIKYRLSPTGRVVRRINPVKLSARLRMMKRTAPHMEPAAYIDWAKSWYRVHRKYMSGQQKRKYKKQTFKLLEVTHGYDYTDRWSYYQRFNS